MTTNTNAALVEYANPLNWDVDENGVRRVWKEPGSETPEAYNGFELAKAALSTAAQPPTHDGGYPAELRDYFAAAALQGWLASFGVEADHPAVSRCSATVAHQAYVMADAMLEAREAK